MIDQILQVNIYNGSQVNLGRADSLAVYKDELFTQLLHRYNGSSLDFSSPLQSESHLALHFRGSAADSNYGFLAVVSVLPSSSPLS